MNTQNVAIIGVGRMGAAMAGTLTRAGFEVTLSNRTIERARALGTLLGATVCDSPAEAAAAADVIISILADDAAVRSSYLGADGLVEGLTAGKVVLEMSTIDPSTVAEIAKLSLPASGSRWVAEAKFTPENSSDASSVPMIPGISAPRPAMVIRLPP